MTPDEQALTTKIGRRLHDARNAQRLSLRALSERTNGKLGTSRIGNYEQGTRRPGIEEAKILAKALGTVSETYLLCLDDEGFLSDQEQELLHRFRRSDNRGRETILLSDSRSRRDEPQTSRSLVPRYRFRRTSENDPYVKLRTM